MYRILTLQNIIIPVNQQPAILTTLLKMVKKNSRLSRMLAQGTVQQDTYEETTADEDILVVEQETEVITKGDNAGGK